MNYLRTTETAELLNITPSMLRAWVERFGFPSTAFSGDGRRRFNSREVEALRTALLSEPSVPAAIAQARAEVWGELLGRPRLRRVA